MRPLKKSRYISNLSRLRVIARQAAPCSLFPPSVELTPLKGIYADDATLDQDRYRLKPCRVGKCAGGVTARSARGLANCTYEAVVDFLEHAERSLRSGIYWLRAS